LHPGAQLLYIHRQPWRVHQLLNCYWRGYSGGRVVPGFLSHYLLSPLQLRHQLFHPLLLILWR
jgi:hypothetical protein